MDDADQVCDDCGHPASLHEDTRCRGTYDYPDQEEWGEACDCRSFVATPDSQKP